jgi:hypothetical protein
MHINHDPSSHTLSLSSHTFFAFTNMARFTLMLTLLAAAVHASPMPDVIERDYPAEKLPGAECKKINYVITILKAYKATPFCSSYLNIPVVTSTTTV